MVRAVPAVALVFGAMIVPGDELAAQTPEEATLTIFMGADTLAIETFTRTGDRLEGELRGAAMGRLVYSAHLASDGGIRLLELRAWMPRAAPDSPPAQSASFTLRGDSMVAEITMGGAVQRQTFSTQEGALPYLNPSMALMGQLVRRAIAVGGERVEIPIFMTAGAQTFTATVTRPTADSAVVALPGASAHFQVDADGRILGGAIPAQNLRIERVEGHASAPPPAVTAPDYSAPEGAPYTAEEVRLETPDGHVLAGTLTRPKHVGQVPAVVTISGSGAQARDSDVISNYRPFRQIADTLAYHGIATLRLDDRGTGASTGDFGAATSLDFADDVRAAVRWLRARNDIDGRRIALVGHSEGGMIAPMVTATDSLGLPVVLLAGTAISGREIIEFQQRSAIERNSEIAEAQRDSALDAAQETIREMAEAQPWLRFFLDYDPLPTARQVEAPVLIVHGATDRQVTVEQAGMLANAIREGGNADVEVRIFPDINHLLLHDPDGNPSGYTSLTDRRIPPAVLGAIVDWLERQF